MAVKLIGTNSNQVPTNGDLGTLAFQDRDSVSIDELTTTGSATVGDLAAGITTLSTSTTSHLLNLVSTEAGSGTGPVLEFYRNSASPASSDALGWLEFYGEEATSSDKVRYAQFGAKAYDVTNTSFDGEFLWQMALAGTLREVLRISPIGFTFNETARDVDFRVESSGNANMLFVDGGNNRVGIGTNIPKNQIQFGNTSVIGQDANSMFVGVNFSSTNTYMGGTNYVVRQLFDRSTGNYKIQHAAQGLADASITYSDSLVVDADGDATFAGKVLVGSGATGSIGGSLEVITGSTGALGTFGGGTGDELYIMNRAAGIVGFQTNSADTLESKSNTISFIDQTNATIATFTTGLSTFGGTGTGTKLAVSTHNSTPGSYNEAELNFILSSNSSATINWDIIAEQTAITWDYEGGEFMRLTNAGDVGIGTSSPSARVQIEDAVDMKLILSGSGSPNINLVSATGDDFLVQNHAGVFRIYNNSDTRPDFEIDGDGDATFAGSVGIGIAAPEALLNVVTNSAGTWTAPTNFNDVVIESNTNAGLVIGLPDADEGVIGISSPSTNGGIGYGMLWDYDVGIGRLFTSKVGASTRLEADNQVTNLTLSGGAGSETATFAGDVKMSGSTLDIVANSDSVPAIKIGANATHGWKIYERATGGHLRLNRLVSGVENEVLEIDRSNGAVDIVGALSKGSGSFKIDHPLPAKKDTHHLVHSFVEGPQADLIYRGRATLSSGLATVDIDVAAGMTGGTFEALCRDVQCFTSNETGWTAVRGGVSGATLTIEAQDNSSTDTISWMVVGERKDKHMYDTAWTDDDGKVIVEPEKLETE